MGATVIPKNFLQLEKKTKNKTLPMWDLESLGSGSKNSWWTHFDDYIFQMGGKKPPTKTIHIAKPCKPCWIHGVFVPVWKKAFCKSHGGSTSPRSAPWLLAEGEVWEMCRLCRLTEWHETEYQGPKPTWNLCSLGLAEMICCLNFSFLFHWKLSRDRFVPLGFLQSADFQKIEFKGYIELFLCTQVKSDD